MVTGSYGTSTTYNYTPPTAGNYVVKLSVRDAQSNTVSVDSATIKVGEQLNIPTVTRTSGNTTVGSNITVKGTASGGIGSKTYSIYVFKNGKIVNKAAYTSSDSITFTPGEAGSYRIRVYVQDDVRARVAKELTLNIS